MKKNKKDKFITFGSPCIGNEEIDEVVDSLKSGWLGTGPKVQQFEEEFKIYKGSRSAVAVNSCTAALHLSLIALGIKAEDEVITTSMTFCSTVNSIIHAGATPVLVDIDPETMNIDPDLIEKKITKKTKCILPVHFAGRPCEMNKIISIAKKHNLYVLEDCAHAIETHYHGQKVGTFGDLGCFSFYVTKNVSTGEGGMVITEDENLSTRIKRLALHGLSRDAWRRYSDHGFQHYYVEEAGFKYNMMDIQAALGIHQLAKVEENLKRRDEIWNKYMYELSDLPIKLPVKIEKESRHARHLFTILINNERTSINRDHFIQKLYEENIGTGVHYSSIPEHPYYKRRFGWKVADYPNALKIGRNTVSLPLSTSLSKEDVDYIIKSVKKILN